MRRARGFTLLEVLVALVLLALFAVASYRGLNAVLEAQRHAREEMTRWRRVNTAFTRMAADLSSALPQLAPSADGGRSFEAKTAQNKAFELVLERLLPEDEPAGVQRIRYRYAEGTLTRRMGLEDETAAGAGFPLLTALRACTLRYLDDAGHWREQWPLPGKPATLPRAVELQLVLDGGESIRRVFRVQ